MKPAMKPGELFITAGLRTAAEFSVVTPAFSALSKVLPGHSAIELLQELERPQTLGKLRVKLGCKEEDVFSTLCDLVGSEVAPPPRQAMSVTELMHLSSPDAQAVLAEGLGCRPSDTIARLFDREVLACLLSEAGIDFPPDSDTQALYYRLIAKADEIEVELGLSRQDWGPELDRRSWLQPAASARLHGAARTNGWDGYSSSEIVVAIMVGSAPETSSKRRTFDSLAITELQRRACQLAEDLRAEAATLARAAADSAPSALTTVARLPGWIELYERRAIVSGLKSLLAGETVVVRTLARDKAWQVSVVDGEPAVGAPLIVQHTKRHTRMGRKVVTFEVAVALRGAEEEPRTIVKATAVPRAAYDDIAFVVKALHSEDLSTEGKQIGERLLNTRVLAPTRGLNGLLRSALERHDAEFARALLLCGENAPIASGVAFREILTKELPFASPTSGSDVRFPKDADALAEELRDEYVANGATLVDLPPVP